MNVRKVDLGGSIRACHDERAYRIRVAGCTRAVRPLSVENGVGCGFLDCLVARLADSVSVFDRFFCERYTRGRRRDQEFAGIVDAKGSERAATKRRQVRVSRSQPARMRMFSK